MSATRRAWMRRLAPVVVGMAIGALGMLVGLAQAGRLAPRDPQAVVALAQMVDAQHKRVDLLIERGDVAAAIAALEAMRDEAWLTREDGGDIAVKLRHDVYGRLLRLRLDHPDVDAVTPQRLLKLADEGLGEDWQDVDTNPFTARLTALRGQTLEKLERDDEALAAYEAALDMNRILLDRELAGGGP